jgi:hypothetical protein
MHDVCLLNQVAGMRIVNEAKRPERLNQQIKRVAGLNAA